MADLKDNTETKSEDPTEANIHPKKILSLAFNQDMDCFSCGTDIGFIIYSSMSSKENYHRTFTNGMNHVEMYYRSNLIVLVGSSTEKGHVFSNNKVVIWDDHQRKCIAELEYKSPIKTIKLNREKIVVVLEDKIYVYNFINLKLIYSIETITNTKGLCAISIDQTVPFTFACPGLKTGTVYVSVHDNNENMSTPRTFTISAHTSNLSKISINRTGTLMATASEKGTLIRVFDLKTAQLIREFRRGSDHAKIYSITFDAESKFLAVTSDKGTAHIYDLTIPPTDKRMLVPAYFQSEYSFTQFPIPTEETICGFPNNNMLLVLCLNGTYYRYIFEGGKKDGKLDHGKFLI